METLTPLRILATTVTPPVGESATTKGQIIAEDGHHMNVQEWINFQEAHMVEFVHRVLSPDPLMEEQPTLSDDEHAALRQSWRILEDPPADLLSSPELKELNTIPEAKDIMADWFERFGTLFNHACREQEVTAEGASKAVSQYQAELIGHVRELRRVIHLHTGQYRPVSELMHYVRSRSFGSQSDSCGAQYLDFQTMFPKVRSEENAEREELIALAEGVLDGREELFSSPDDAFSRTVDGRRGERRRLVELLLHSPESIVVLDAREEHLTVIPLNVYGEGARKLSDSEEGQRCPRQCVGGKGALSI